MPMFRTFLKVSTATLVLLAGAMTAAATAQTRDNPVPTTQTTQQRTVALARAEDPGQTYTSSEIVDAGHRFFGTTTKGLAQVVEYVFQRAGQPKGYIIGEEGSGAFVGGLRYGEGQLFMKDGHQQKIFWQGPSVGFDFGGNGSRVLVLVYDIDHPSEMYDRFPGIEGSAYFVGGLGVNFQANDKIKLAPIRTGVGARLGANIGYLKYSERPTLNPF